MRYAILKKSWVRWFDSILAQQEQDIERCSKPVFDASWSTSARPVDYAMIMCMHVCNPFLSASASHDQASLDEFSVEVGTTSKAALLAKTCENSQWSSPT